MKTVVILVFAVVACMAGCKQAAAPAPSSAGSPLPREQYIRRAYAAGEGELTPTAPKGELRVIAPPERYTGLWRMWYENGILAVEETYLDGKQHGYSYWWNDDGTYFCTVHYVNGQGSMSPGRREDQQ